MVYALLMLLAGASLLAVIRGHAARDWLFLLTIIVTAVQFVGDITSPLTLSF